MSNLMYCANSRPVVRAHLLSAVVLAFGVILSPLVPAAHGQSTSLPPPEAAGFEHAVVVMMENRSFDHFFGWLPGANGQQTGLTFLNSAGNSHPTHSLPPDY